MQYLDYLNWNKTDIQESALLLKSYWFGGKFFRLFISTTDAFITFIPFK